MEFDLETEFSQQITFMPTVSQTELCDAGVQPSVMPQAGEDRATTHRHPPGGARRKRCGQEEGGKWELQLEFGGVDLGGAQDRGKVCAPKLLE